MNEIFDEYWTRRVEIGRLPLPIEGEHDIALIWHQVPENCGRHRPEKKGDGRASEKNNRGNRRRYRGLFSRRTEINGFRLQALRTQGLQASINATASISSNLDKAFPFNTNHGKPLISVLLLNKP